MLSLALSIFGIECELYLKITQMSRLLLFFILPILTFGQPDIKTVQLFNPQSNDQKPVIAMNEYLIFSFDDLESNYKRYEYQIVRYDRFWQLSDVFQSEFLNGYQKNYIREYKNSFNTRVPYVHYEVQIPNRDFSFKLSDNYAIQIMEPNSSKVLLEKRFSVYEDLTAIGVKVDRINNLQDRNQQVAIQVASRNQFDLTQNQQESMLVILKNNNWEESIVLQQPVFAQPFQFTYNQMDNVFAGGVEYQWFDTKNLEIASLTTERIIRDDVYKTVLYPIGFEPDETYLDRPDVNGNFYIRSSSIPNPSRADSEADYTEVYFALGNYKPAENEEICVYGAFTNFECTPTSTLKYVPETQLWETSMMLKQGYYNYSFAVKDKYTGETNFSKITGSYWQTENEYSALMYYRPWGKRYDLLIGYGEGYSRPSQR